MAVILVLTTKLKKKKKSEPRRILRKANSGTGLPTPTVVLSVRGMRAGGLFGAHFECNFGSFFYSGDVGNYRTIRLFSMYVSHAASQCHGPLGPPVPPVFPGSPLPSRRPSALCPRLSPQSRGQRLVCIRSGAEGWGSESPHTTLSARCGQGERRGKNVEVCNDARCSAGRRGCPEPGRLTLPAVRKA